MCVHNMEWFPFFFFFKQKTAYEMRISDWSSDVCSSDLGLGREGRLLNAGAGKTWFRQPRGLTILFLTQMWELFSYYGMRTLLVYDLTKQLSFAQNLSSFIYGPYTSFATFMPTLGGATDSTRLPQIFSLFDGS